MYKIESETCDFPHRRTQNCFYFLFLAKIVTSENGNKLIHPELIKVYWRYLRLIQMDLELSADCRSRDLSDIRTCHTAAVSWA